MENTKSTMESIKMKRLTATAIVPHYAREGDAGLDFFADETVMIQPGERHAVSTGIAVAIPLGYAGLVWDKSGIASQQGLKTMGGVIDSGYRGEVKIIVHNLSQKPCCIEAGKKIAQVLIQPVLQRALQEVEELDDTERGEGGFGSTGL